MQNKPSLLLHSLRIGWWWLVTLLVCLVLLPPFDEPKPIWFHIKISSQWSLKSHFVLPVLLSGVVILVLTLANKRHRLIFWLGAIVSWGTLSTSLIYSFLRNPWIAQTRVFPLSNDPEGLAVQWVLPLWYYYAVYLLLVPLFGLWANGYKPHFQRRLILGIPLALYLVLMLVLVQFYPRHLGV